MISVVDQAQREANEMKTEGIPGAADFKAVYLTFLNSQDTILKNEFKEVVDILKDRTLAPVIRQERFQAILQRTAQKEQVSLPALQAAQREFGKKNNFRVP